MLHMYSTCITSMESGEAGSFELLAVVRRDGCMKILGIISSASRSRRLAKLSGAFFRGALERSIRFMKRRLLMSIP